MSLHEMNVEYVAGLARIALNGEEKELFQRQLDTIVDYVRKISEVNLDGVEPTSHGRNLVNVMRADEPHAGLTTEQALENAPSRIGRTFRVPRIIE